MKKGTPVVCIEIQLQCDVISKVTFAVVLPWQTALGGQLQCGVAAVLTVTAATSVLWLRASYDAVYNSKPC